MAHLFKRADGAPMANGPPESAASFRAPIVQAARSVLAGARRALADEGSSEAEAVHELRKAFKRWRALLRLLHDPVGAAAEEMRGEARELMRRLSPARDGQSALDALDDLAGGAPLPPTSLERMRARLKPLRAAAENAAFTPELRARIGSYLDDAARSLDDWPQMSFDTIADALAVTYARARRLAPEDWAQADAAQLHALRRRVVEHQHQMELTEPLWPRLARLWVDEAQRLRNRLGACQDLTVLEMLTEPHRPLAAWRARLAPAIAARRAAHLQAAARLAGRLFAEKPKAFRARIAALRETGEMRIKKSGGRA